MDGDDVDDDGSYPSTLPPRVKRVSLMEMVTQDISRDGSVTQERERGGPRQRVGDTSRAGRQLIALPVPDAPSRM